MVPPKSWAPKKDVTVCIQPSFIYALRGPKYVQLPVPCKKCWSCIADRLNSYVGRALCEAHYCQKVVTVTLTYAPREDLADKVLTPFHFQTFIRRLRRRGHSVRYLVAGEYGELKARAHFHVILFFSHLARELPWPDRENCNDHDVWPHGHLYADFTQSERAIRYVCKYLLKAEDKETWFSLSKKPSIGAQFFDNQARHLAAHGVWPRGFEYRPPGSQSNRKYLLTGATRRDYVLALLRYHPDPPPLDQLTKWVRHFIEKGLRQIYLANVGPMTPEDEQDYFDRKKNADENDFREKMERQRIDSSRKWMEGSRNL